MSVPVPGLVETMRTFALTGVAGFVAPRHLRAITETGNRLVAALDPHDAVGVLDRFFPETRFFTEFERFDRHLEKLRRAGPESRVDYLSICSPNYLHDAHIRLALRLGAHAICEKPLVINPWNLDALQELESESAGRVFTVLQLRLHPALVALKTRLDAEPGGDRDVCLTYITGRGPWYDVSWKGVAERSGGLAVNIGIHFFDLMIWLFGPAGASEVHRSEPGRMAGCFDCSRARVRWFLSTRMADLPPAAVQAGRTTHRSITLDGTELEFTEGFTDLHTRVYAAVLGGGGFTIEDARPSIELAYRVRTSAPVPSRPDRRHPVLPTLEG
jgi:UDP-N-acetyl-2-amino-2-deoxyglucuronate dehydrogenase